MSYAAVDRNLCLYLVCLVMLVCAGIGGNVIRTMV